MGTHVSLFLDLPVILRSNLYVAAGTLIYRLPWSVDEDRICTVQAKPKFEPRVGICRSFVVKEDRKNKNRAYYRDFYLK